MKNVHKFFGYLLQTFKIYCKHFQCLQSIMIDKARKVSQCMILIDFEAYSLVFE